MMPGNTVTETEHGVTSRPYGAKEILEGYQKMGSGGYVEINTSEGGQDLKKTEFQT